MCGYSFQEKPLCAEFVGRREFLKEKFLSQREHSGQGGWTFEMKQMELPSF